METWEAKLIVLFSMFSIAFISGVIPIKLVDVIRGKRRRSHQSSADSPGHGDVSPANVAGGATVRKVGDIEAAETTIPGGGGQTMLRNSTYSSLSSALSKDSAFGDQLTFGGVMTCSRTTADQVLAMLNCFAGGVFLATSLLHLLPDVRKDIEQVLDAFGRTSVEFPLAEFVTSVGFFVVMAIEQV